MTTPDPSWQDATTVEEYIYKRMCINDKSVVALKDNPFFKKAYARAKARWVKERQGGKNHETVQL